MNYVLRLCRSKRWNFSFAWLESFPCRRGCVGYRPWKYTLKITTISYILTTSRDCDWGTGLDYWWLFTV